MSPNYPGVYSYPKAFAKEEWVRYGEIWKNVMELLRTLTGPEEEAAIKCTLDKEYVVAVKHSSGGLLRQGRYRFFRQWQYLHGYRRRQHGYRFLVW